MGYCTRYTLTWDNQPIGEPPLIAEWRETSTGASHAIAECGDTLEESKWYDHEADVKRLSESFPDVLFCLEGEGDESGDLWRKYFLAGAMERCGGVVAYPPCTLRVVER